MITSAAAPGGVGAPAIRFHWILDRRSDLAFYIGSALAGWAYVAVIVYALASLADPLRDPLGTVAIGGLQVALTLNLLVMVSWAFSLDAPHVWATLGRTLLDPGEWRARGPVLRRSFALFLLGPAAILLPYVAAPWLRAAGGAITPAGLAFGAVAFFVFFRLWAYYHVVRQHWGFFTLYKRKAGEQDARTHRVDTWFFNLSLYLHDDSVVSLWVPGPGLWIAFAASLVAHWRGGMAYVCQLTSAVVSGISGSAQADAAIAASNFAAAESAVQRLLDMNPNDAEMVIRLAQIKGRLNKTAEANALYQRAMQLSQASGQPGGPNQSMKNGRAR